MSTPDTRDAGLSTGEFGRRCGLSHKALRLYDMSGLLPPAHVDPFTGHRRYTVEQLERARRISLLRQLEMPLATVAEVLAGTDEEAVARLDRWWAGQEAALRAKRGSLAWLRARLGRSGEVAAAALPVRLRSVAEAKVAAIRRDVDQPALVPTMMAAEDELRRHLRAGGAEPTGELWVIYHGRVTPDSEAPVEVCLPFTGTVDPAGPIVIRIEPARTEAYATMARDDCYYPRIMLAYDTVEAWQRRSGRPGTGPPREVYFARWEDTGGADPFCHVAQPIGGNPA
jgi:DNA-binding transcriptional MerR regulator